MQAAVLAIIARAVHRIAGHILEEALLWLIAGTSLAATLASVPFWIPLIAGELAHASHRATIKVGIVTAAVAAAALLGMSVDVGAGAAASVTAAGQASVLALFAAGLKGGLLTFGGAYTALPYVRGDTVGRGWLADGAFLDGVALAGVLPAPLVIFATFAGYMVGGWPGAVAITAGMFLPAFAFSMIFYERLEAVVANPALHRLLAGVPQPWSG